MTVVQTTAPVRYHYMDAMRSILMMLGIVLHSAQLYNPDTTWVMKAPDTNHFFSLLVTYISMFRMPVFFMVSGFFCLMTLKKYGSGKFLNLRLKRLLLPMFTVACSFNLLQTYILSGYYDKEFTLLQYLASGEWLGHMWFLLFLSIYFLFSAVFSVIFRFESIKMLFASALTSLERIPVLVLLLILGFFSPFVQLLVKFFPFDDSFYQLFYWSDVINYFQFFLVGIVFFARKSLLMRFTSLSLWLTVSACVFFLVAKGLVQSELVVMPEKLGKITSFYLGNVAVLFAASICFNIFYNLANYGNAIFNYLSDAAYSVYLIHHVLIVILGILVIKMGFGVWLGYFCVVLVTTFLAVGFHEIIRRSNLLRLLFNGK